MCKKRGGGVQITQNENLTSHKPTHTPPSCTPLHHRLSTRATQHILF